MDRPMRKRRTPGAATPRWWRRAATAAATVIAVAVGSFLVAVSAQAVSYAFVIDSLDGTVAARDVTPGDGLCRTATGTCTLLAALQESNALNAPAGAVTITAAAGLRGNIDASVAAQMQTTSVSGRDAGAHFAITAPVSIDLDNRVTVQTSVDSVLALFHVNASNVSFRNMSQILSGMSSLVMGPQANGFVLDGGSSVTDQNYNPERFLVIREGAQNITVRNYRIQGFYHSSTLTGIFYINAQNATPIRNIKIDNVQITYLSGSGACNGTDGTGCRTDILQFLPRNQNVVLDGFAFTNSSVANLTDRAGFPFATDATTGSSVRASNIDISGNRFTNVQGTGTGVNNAFITLPYGAIGGTNRIVGNSFVRATSGQSVAVSWNGNTTTGNAGALTIAQNYFDGYSDNSVSLTNTGTVTVEKNTFGARSASQSRPALLEETSAGTGTLVSNGPAANGRLATWYPTADATVVTGALPSTTVNAVSPLAAGTPVCLASVAVSAPSTSPGAPAPVDLDLYWTADRTAEVYLGRAHVASGSSATVQLSLPIGAQQLPTTVVGTTQPVTIVDATSGTASGYIRVQTLSDGASSQYSRIVGFSGSCRPDITIEQSAGQNDPTLARDLHFRVTSTIPLDPASVTDAAVQLTAEAVAGTIDATRLNPRTITVTPVAGSADRQFDVVARVDDSARVTAAIPAATVRSVGGLTNRLAATGTDRTIEFQNPVVARPAALTVVTGDAVGQQFSFALLSGAPQTTASLSFASTVDAEGTTRGVGLSSSDADIAAGATATAATRVTAAAGDVPPNTPVTITTTLASDDPNYDALVVSPVMVRLFSTDPSVRIEKTAYTGVTDASSPERIRATGTEALSGSRLTDGQAVCFVYTVTNTSSDDWATVLTDVAVSDSDTRLGDAGHIGVIPRLEIGASAEVSACGTLIPVDTTAGDAG